ncbi:MAG TPA: GNAT family N-acetyltransferase [Vicinamibacteria bacterium]|nr:GNAT family N-acetyltransferase [Vicinamibacteria bacterium]
MSLVLETERVFLRELLLNDVEPLETVLANAGASDKLSPPSARAFILAQRDSYREHGLGVWAAVHRESGMVLGYAGLRRESESDPELWCLIDVPYRGHGLGTEVATAILHHARERIGVERVIAFVPPDDEGAHRFVETLGMSLDDGERHLFATR